MQHANRNGIPFHRRARSSRGKPDLKGYDRPPTQTSVPVAVTYRDGAVMTFLFDRSTTVVDLAALIARAGSVRKVVL